MNSGHYPLSRQDNIVIQELNNEVLIYDLTKNKALCLNQTSAMIWQECDGKKSVTEISQILSKRLKSNVSEDVIWLALNQFKKDELLKESENFVTPLDGLSRREVVKRIGFASMIALPVISAIIAPRAVQAQSAGGSICGCGGTNNDSDAGCPCNDNGDCCGVCGGNGCSGPTAPSTPTDSPCCFGSLCGPNAPSGTNSRPQGAPCNDNNDCCGVCQGGGVCGAPTCPAQPFAAACCPPLDCSG